MEATKLVKYTIEITEAELLQLIEEHYQTPIANDAEIETLMTVGDLKYFSVNWSRVEPFNLNE